MTVLNLSVLFSHGWPSQELPSCCICFLVLIVQELFSEPDNREFFITVGRDLISRILLNAEKVSFVYNYIAVSMYMCVVRIVVIYTVSKVSLWTVTYLVLEPVDNFYTNISQIKCFILLSNLAVAFALPGKIQTHSCYITVLQLLPEFIQCCYYQLRWLGSLVVSMLDSGAEGPGFKSQSRRSRVAVLGKLFTPIVPLFTKQ